MAPSDQDALSLQVLLPQMLDLALGTPEVSYEEKKEKKKKLLITYI